MVRTDRRSPAGFLVRCSANADFSFIRSRVWAPMAAESSIHTLVSFVMKPWRTRAVRRLSLLGEQRADT